MLWMNMVQMQKVFWKKIALDKERGNKRMNIKQELLNADLGLNENDFDRHESDLQVLDDKGYVYIWLMVNYKFAFNVTRFIACSGTDWSGKNCVEIPFAVG